MLGYRLTQAVPTWFGSSSDTLPGSELHATGCVQLPMLAVTILLHMSLLLTSKGLSVQRLGMKRRTMVGRCSLELLAGKSYTVSMEWPSNTNKRAFLDLRPQVLFAHFVHVGVDVLGMVPVIEHAVDAGFTRATEPNFLSKKEETGM